MTAWRNNSQYVSVAPPEGGATYANQARFVSK